MLPPQPAQPPRAGQPRTPPQVQPQPPAASAQPGTRQAPRRIEMAPPAALDDAVPRQAPPAPSGPPINSVPVAPLE